MPARIITLLSDFGTKDQYVASMRGAILSVNPSLRIIDITHHIPKYNIRIASFILAQSASTFPRGTVHVAIVDPGVGTKRLPIIIKTKNYHFVGPDNGLLATAAEQDEIVSIHKIENPKYMRQNVSFTFHGRDVFAPAAAHLASGVKIQKFGSRQHAFTRIEQMGPHFEDSRVSGEVTAIDSFGNVVTNIPGQEIMDRIKQGERILVKFGRSELNVPFLQTYGDVREGEILSLIGSSTFLELGINRGNFAEKFHDVEMGMRVEIEFLGKPS
jgi:S-adenosylmethionine hydrolase